jgi:hypothetical protein
MSTRKAGRRIGRAVARGPTGAVAPREHRGNGRRQRRRQLQETNGSGAGDRYTKRGRLRERPSQKAGGRYRRPLQEATVAGGRYRKRAAAMSAAVTESGRPLQAAVAGSGRYRRPLQEAGGGDVSGRYINNSLRQDASTGDFCPLENGRYT